MDCPDVYGGKAMTNKRVPREPTAEMASAGWMAVSKSINPIGVWQAMLDAAPEMVDPLTPDTSHMDCLEARAAGHSTAAICAPCNTGSREQCIYKKKDKPINNTDDARIYRRYIRIGRTTLPATPWQR